MLNDRLDLGLRTLTDVEVGTRDELPIPVLQVLPDHDSVTHTASRSVGAKLRASSTLTLRVRVNLRSISAEFGTLAAAFSKLWTDMAILPD